MIKQLSILLLLAFGCSTASFCAPPEENIWTAGTDSEKLELIYKKIKERGPKFKSLLAAAQILERQKNKTKVVEYLEKALPLATTSEQVRACGQLFLKIHFYGKAKQLFEKGIAMDPQSPGAYTDLCHINQELHDYSAALNAINQALRLDPVSREALYYRANVFMALNRFQEAKQDLDQIKSQKQPMDEYFYMTLGTLNLQLGDEVEAEKNLRKALKRNNNMVHPHQSLASMYERQQRWNDAYHEMDECLKLSQSDSDKASILVRRSNCLRNLDVDVDAILDMTTAIKLTPREQYYYIRAEQLEREGRNLAAIRDCTRALDLGFAPAKVLKLRSDCYRKVNDIDHALLDLNACIKLRPEADLLQRRFKLLRIKGKNEEALCDIDEAIKLKSNNSEYHFLRGTALAELGEHQRALKDFELASLLDPNDERFTTAIEATNRTLKPSRKKQ